MKKIVSWPAIRKVFFDPFTLVTLLLVANMVYIPFMWHKVTVLTADVRALTPAATDSTTATTTSSGPLTSVTATDHIEGTTKAKVELVEYADLECPFCKEYNPEMQQVVKDFGDKVAWIYRPYPLSFHQNAEKEAEAQECVADQGGNAAFWKFSDAIFQQTTSNGTGFALTALEPLAVSEGLNGTTFNDCLNSGKYAQKVAKSEADGTTAGVTGTPATFLIANGGTPQLIQGAVPLTQLESLVKAALQ